ncbi:MAG TPA: neutral/alkaline non-lysosomal ceramidase N-terminal domain-containing protein [Acidimicrobiales bacterium]|nr:neutral/alkaline non-lysosomal ceramidase N-terminal domain-containing protein [Acidimicrobiales bacterium]
MRRLVILLTAALVAATTPVLAKPPLRPPAPGLRAGVGVADMTWHVGASAGQYATDEPAVGTDPHAHSVKQRASYGVQSRLTARALVLEGTNGERVALVKTDNYLAQDLLTRRVAQLLPPALGLGADRIVMSATHNHSSPYYSTPAVGVWVFQDVWDVRAFEYQARRIAAAVTAAATNLRPARLGATTVDVGPIKGNIAGRGASPYDDSPYGYPDTFGDHGVVVLRVDDVSARKPTPLATWMNYGQHPESLDGYNLISGDFVAPLERFVDGETGSTLVFTQGDVGSAEGPYDRGQTDTVADGVVRAFAHVGYAQAERFARILADAVAAAWHEIGAGGGTVPFTRDIPIGVFDGWIPGPVSHPYPGVNACDTDETLRGNPGVGTAADCTREADTGVDLADQVRENLEAHGIPVPDSYDMPAFGTVEENARIHLQAVRLGEILLASCSCEAQVDLILNLESRTDGAQDNIWDGYDWAERDCTAPTPPSTTWRCPTGPAPDAAIQHMRAQVHRPADGWDDLAYAPFANSENPNDIKGNFTKQEIQDLGMPGYALSVGLGHTGDYVGYTVSYREYMARDHYRKALTSYGPHTADYMVTRLVRMAAHLRDADKAHYDPFTDEPLGAVAAADEARQAATAVTAGQVARAAYDGYELTLPDDLDGGTVPAGGQPAPAIERFSAAEFSWYGGSNYVDNPEVRVERFHKGRWQPHAGQAGEVQTRLDLGGRVGESRRWRWTANFEAFDGFRASEGQTPSGTYRFVAVGRHRTGRATVPYTVTSQPFAVRPWDGVPVQDLRIEPDGSVSLSAAPHAYPRTYASKAFASFVRDDGNPRVCKTCSFRPWATHGTLAEVTVTVVRADGRVERFAATQAGDRWTAPTALAAGDRAYVEAGDAVDTWNEINGTRSVEVVK